MRFNFIKPGDIIKDKNIYNNKYTAQDKIKTIIKAFSLLQNSISFCSGKKV